MTQNECLNGSVAYQDLVEGQDAGVGGFLKQSDTQRSSKEPKKPKPQPIDVASSSETILGAREIHVKNRMRDLSKLTEPSASSEQRFINSFTHLVDDITQKNAHQ